MLLNLGLKSTISSNFALASGGHLTAEERAGRGAGPGHGGNCGPHRGKAHRRHRTECHMWCHAARCH